VYDGGGDDDGGDFPASVRTSGRRRVRSVDDDTELCWLHESTAFKVGPIHSHSERSTVFSSVFLEQSAF